MVKRSFWLFCMRILKKIPSMKMNTTRVSAVFLCLFVFVSANAQLRLPSRSGSDLRQALEKVITDYSKGFSNLKGDLLNDSDPQRLEYASLLTFKTAETNTIIQYSGASPIYSWQAQLLSTDDFAVAEKKYNSLYKELKGISLTLNRDYTYALEGTYGAPNESLGFASTEFHLTPSASSLPKVKVELSLQYEMPEWKIRIAVYQKEREDNERGKVRED